MAIAFTILSLRLEWCGRALVFVLSITAEFATITDLLQALSFLTPRNAVVLIDSACTIQRISTSPVTSTLTHDFTNPAHMLTRRNPLVVHQWILGNVRISENTPVDRPVNDAHRKPDVSTCVADFRSAACELARALCEPYALAFEKRPTSVYIGLSREKSTSLTRLRARGSFTKKW